MKERKNDKEFGKKPRRGEDQHQKRERKEKNDGKGKTKKEN